VSPLRLSSTYKKRAFEIEGLALNYQYCLDAKLTWSTGNGVENIIGSLSKQPHTFEHYLAVSDVAGFLASFRSASVSDRWLASIWLGSIGGGLFDELQAVRSDAVVLLPVVFG
jgi:hypothetical protein